MIKLAPSTLLSAALFAAAPALAQTAAPPPAPQASPAPPAAAAPDYSPPPAFMTAAQAFGRCVGTKSQAAPATATPEIVARQALTACANEKRAMETNFEAWVASPNFPEAGRAEARTQFKAQMDTLETQIAAKVRDGRTAAAAAPTPAPSATPRP